MKKAVNYVAVNRAEGPCDECFSMIFYVGAVAPQLADKHFNGACLVPVKADEIAKAVLDQFRKWGYSAPKEGGYDKCDFEVGWEGGEVYNGRFDMEYGGAVVDAGGRVNQVAGFSEKVFTMLLQTEGVVGKEALPTVEQIRSKWTIKG